MGPLLSLAMGALAPAQAPVVEVVETGCEQLLTAIAFDGLGRRGWAVGGASEDGPGLVLRTLDGGRTWEASETPGGRLYGVMPSNRTAAALCGLGGALFVDPPGNRLRPPVQAHHPFGEAWFAAVARAGDVEVFVGSKDGAPLVFRDARGGFSRVEALPAAVGSRGVRGLAFVSDRVGFACGDGGLLWRSRDAGETWHACDVATESWLKGMSFVDERTGFVVGGPAVVLRTDDGGDSWRELPTPLLGKFNGVAFVDADRGYVVEAGGTLLWTRDGGQTWGMTALGRELTSAYRAVDDDVWITCGDGRLLRIAARPRGSIRGRLMDDAGQPVVGASVYPCAPSGAPLIGDGGLTLGHALAEGGGDLAVIEATTDASGRFELELPRGAYRLVTQSWGAGEATGGRQPFEHPAAELTLHGVAAVEVVAGRAVDVSIAPLGTGEALIEAPVPNDWNVLVLSTAPPHTAPILFLAAWGGGFGKNLIGGVRMRSGRTLVRGLPAGVVYVGVAQNDNMPSAGLSRCEVAAGERVTCSIDLKDRTMPAAIAVLDRALEGVDVERLVQDATADLEGMRGETLRWMFAIGERGDREVDLGAGRKVRLADLFALHLYRTARR